MGVLTALERGFHVLLACGEYMGAPRGLIPFSKTPISIATNGPDKQQLYVISSITVILLIISFWFKLAIILAMLLGIIGLTIERRIRLKNCTPLAVNLNHPFMETDSVSDSEVMVNFSDEWINPGIHRLKLARDPIMGWMVHKQDGDLSILSAWDTKWSEANLSKQLAIINQAISLNNAVNDSRDEFEDARVRESQDSILLEREWIPEEELNLQGPISRFFTSE